MRQFPALLLAAVLLLFGAGCGQETAEVSALGAQTEGLEGDAAALVRDLAAGEYRKLLREYPLTEELSAALTAPMLRRSMRDIVESCGEPQAVQAVVSFTQSGGAVNCYVTVEHALKTLVYSVAFDPQGRVAAITPEPSFDAAALLRPPDRALPDGALQAEAVVGDLQRSGALLLPDGGADTVVLLIGPQDRDRDGGYGGALPLRDIAYDLAERGIASLRLDGALWDGEQATPKSLEEWTVEALTYLRQHHEGFETILVAASDTGQAIAALETLELPYWHCYELDLSRLPDGREPELADPDIAAEIAAQVREITGLHLRRRHA